MKNNDGRKNNGGHSTGSNAGRKKGSVISAMIKKCVDNLMEDMLSKDLIREKIKTDLIKMSLNNGWIYVIKDNQTKLTKIGITQKDNAKQRLSTYSSHNMDIKLLFIDKVQDCFSLENNIHERISDKRIKGDWFKLSSDEIIGLFRIISEYKHKSIFNGRW